MQWEIEAPIVLMHSICVEEHGFHNKGFREGDSLL